MKQDMKKWLEELKNTKIKKPMPVLSFPGIQILDITVKDLVTDGDLQAQCMKAIADRYDTAAAVSNMDLSVEAEAFGAKVIFSDKEVPAISGALLDSDKKIEEIVVPPVGAGRTGEYIKAINIASKLITDRPVFAGVIGPFSLAGRLMDITEIMVKCLLEPDNVHKVLKAATEFAIKYINAFKDAGANGIVMAEPVAGLLSPDMCSEFSSTYVKETIDAVEADDFLVIYHNCGNTVPLVNSIISTGAKVIHLGNVINLLDVIDKYPSHTVIMGNINPSDFLTGSETTIKTATKSLLSKLDAYPNWVISSGCDIPPMSPLANIDAFFETVKAHYAS